MTDTPLRRVTVPAAGISAPADKRFRRSSLRPGRRKGWQFWFVRAGLFVVATGIAAALLWTLGNAVMDAGMFRVAHLEIEGNTRLSAAEVRELVDGLEGESVFRADLDDYRRRLLDAPWVLDASLWRVLPSSIQIVITEREPFAVARLNGGFYLIDRHGVLIDDAGPERGEFDLPIVDGLFPEGRGTTADPVRVEILDRLVTAVETRADLRDRLSQINLSDARNAAVLLDDEPAWLWLGTDQFVEGLQRYLDGRDAARKRFAAIDYYDLRFEDRVIAGPARGGRVDRP